MSQRVIGHLFRQFRALQRDRRGSVAMVAAAGMVMMTGAAALVIDIGAVYTERNQLQTVADLAALGAAQELPNADAARARAAALIEAGLECSKRRRGGPSDQASATAHDAVAERRPDQKGSDCGTYSATIDAGAVRLGHWDETTGQLTPADDHPPAIEIVLRRSESLDNAVPTTFGRLFAVTMIDVEARAVATRGGADGMELALVLDVSGSMRHHGKIEQLRRVAIDLVDGLYDGQETRPNLSVSVVPFAGRVNIVRYGRGWMADIPPTSSTLCTALRSGNRKNDDTPPSVEAFSTFSGAACPDSPMLALTRERATVRAALQSLEIGFATSTQIGTVWGWRALSPRWRGLWGDPDLPSDHGTPDIRKVAVIMTDGENRPHYSGDPFSIAEADQQLADQCEAMKAAGITIYTITFDAPASIDPLYRACASDPDKFHRAADGIQLARAFQAIGTGLTARPRLIR